MTSTGVQAAAPGYRERLTPSLWAIVGAAVVAPMATMVFVPLDKTLALLVGAAVAVAVVWVMVGTASVLTVQGGVLRAGRAHIPVALLGQVDVFDGAEARRQRGPALDARSWHLIRSGVDGLIRVTVLDVDDPATSWVISSRTPDRLAAAIRRAQTVARG